MKHSFIDPKKLNTHEEVSTLKCIFLSIKLLIQRVFTKPILVDQHSHTILDGHHRATVATWLGFKKIPVILVDYLNHHGIQVYSRRNTIAIDKEKVIEMAKSKNNFPRKTTRHVIEDFSALDKQIQIPLKELLL